MKQVIMSVLGFLTFLAIVAFMGVGGGIGIFIILGIVWFMGYDRGADIRNDGRGPTDGG